MTYQYGRKNLKYLFSARSLEDLRDHWNWFYCYQLNFPWLRFRQALSRWIYPGDVIGYMCKVDAECELGGAMGGNTVYPSEKDLRRNARCVDSCGIREVHVTLGRVIQESNHFGDEE